MAETLQQGIDENGVLQGDLVKYLKNVRDLVNSIQTEKLGDTLSSPPGLAIGSTAQNVANDEFHFKIAGNLHRKAAVAAGTALNGVSVPQNEYAAWRFQIGTDGTIDVVRSTASGYASAVAAYQGVPVLAADHVEMGYITVVKTDGNFVPTTTGLDDGNTTVVYTDGSTGKTDIVTTALTLDR